MIIADPRERLILAYREETRRRPLEELERRPIAEDSDPTSTLPETCPTPSQ
jgi:hypothetical protein